MSTPIITVKELQQLLDEQKELIILDVRPKEQRDEWKIAGSLYLDAYKSLSEGNHLLLDEIEIPADTLVVTVCAAGRVSQIASAALRQRGIEAASLEGGMKAWNYAWNTAEITGDNVTIIQVRRVAKGCLSYIIGSGDEAMVVDASLDPEVYIQLAAQHNLAIKYVTDTHIHADYISRTIDLAKATGAVHLFHEDAAVEYEFTPLKDRAIVTVGATQITAVFTPGHTPESTSYLVNDSYLLTGDTLFTDGVGRPDLKADHEQGLHKASQLFDSFGRMLTLSRKDLLVLPAHTAQTVAFNKEIIAGKIAELFQTIALLRLSKADFIEQTMKRIPPTPPNYLQIAAINKIGQHEGVNPADLEAGANRCAVS